jgi:hypothetical protein
MTLAHSFGHRKIFISQKSCPKSMSIHFSYLFTPRIPFYCNDLNEESTYKKIQKEVVFFTHFITKKKVIFFFFFSMSSSDIEKFSFLKKVVQNQCQCIFITYLSQKPYFLYNGLNGTSTYEEI